MLYGTTPEFLRTSACRISPSCRRCASSTSWARPSRRKVDAEAPLRGRGATAERRRTRRRVDGATARDAGAVAAARSRSRRGGRAARRARRARPQRRRARRARRRPRRRRNRTPSQTGVNASAGDGVTVANMRLQKFLAQAGVSSRRQAEQLIRAGAVSVNGQASSPRSARPSTRRRTASRSNGRRVVPEKPIYRLCSSRAPAWRR